MGFKCKNCLFQSSSFLISLPPASPLCGLTELLESGSVLFVIELQSLVTWVTKVQWVVQPKTCSLSVFDGCLVQQRCQCEQHCSHQQQLVLTSALPCSWAKSWFGEYFQVKNSSARQSAERTDSPNNRASGAAPSAPPLLKAKESSRLGIKWVLEGLQQKPSAEYDLVTLCRSLKMVNNISL